VRKTKVNLYGPMPGEKAMIYEMGIPIVELGMTNGTSTSCRRFRYPLIVTTLTHPLAD